MHNKKTYYTLGIIAVVIFLYIFFISAPRNFSVGSTVKIEEGESLLSVSERLKEENIIRSTFVFKAFMVLFGGDKKVIKTDYYFEDEIPVSIVAWRMAHGINHLAPVVITLPEGFTNGEMAAIISFKLDHFNKEKFLKIANSFEGYLFPDTYFFLSTDTEAEVFQNLRDNYEKKITPIRREISSARKTEKDIIVMASLIEGEAKGDEDRGIISGILWQRIKINMPLQVDIAPETYKRAGLPKNPIDNPGLAAIEAALHPVQSPYLYYLHDKNGVIHYAKTYSEHLRNISKYLK